MADSNELADVRHRSVALLRALDEYERLYLEKVRAGGADRSPEQRERHQRTAELQEDIVSQAHHLRKALDKAEFPAFDADLAERVKLLRNLLEHWDEQRDSFANPSLPKAGSGRLYAKRFPDRTPWSSSWSRGEGFVIGGVINLGELRELLQRVEHVLRVS